MDNESNYCVSIIKYKNVNYVTIISNDKIAHDKLLMYGRKDFVCHCVKIRGSEFWIGGNGGMTVTWIGELLRKTFKDDYTKCVKLIRIDL